jgi:hypothetical protein
MVCHIPVEQKVRKDIYFEETSCFHLKTVPWWPGGLGLLLKSNL